MSPGVSSPPTFAELATALRSLSTPPSDGLNKHVATIVVAATLAIGAWVVSGLSNVQATLGSVQVTVDATKKTTEDMQRDIKSISDQQSDMKADQAKLEQRVENLERSVGKAAPL